MDTAKLNYAAYLAYQSYSDRVVNILPGAFDQGGFNPVASVINRAVRDKLDDLKQTSDELLNYILYNFQKNDSAAVVPMNDAADYPDQLRMSTFRGDW